MDVPSRLAYPTEDQQLYLILKGQGQVVALTSPTKFDSRETDQSPHLLAKWHGLGLGFQEDSRQCPEAAREVKIK